MFNYRFPQKRRRSCRVQTEFRQPREDNFHNSVSQCSLHQESLCKVSDYEISPHSKYNLPEICCCDSRGRAVYWLYKHNLADGECVRQIKCHRPLQRGSNAPNTAQKPVCAQYSLGQSNLNKQQQFRRQLLKLRDIIVREPSSDIRITETHNSYLNLADIEAFHILLSEDNLCRDKYHNLVMNLEVKQKLLEDAHRKFTKKYNTLQGNPSGRQLAASNTNQCVRDVSSKDLRHLFSIESFYESNILSANALEMNDLDHILNQLNFFIQSKRINTISESQRERLAKCLKIISNEFEDNYQKREKLKLEINSKVDQRLAESKPSVLELTKMRFIDSCSEIEFDPFNIENNKKNSASNVHLSKKRLSFMPHEKTRISSLGSIVDTKKEFRNVEAKKCHSSELKKDSDKDFTKKSREKSKSTRKPKSDKRKSHEELERLKKALQEKEKAIQRFETADSEAYRIKQLLRDQELERLRAEEKEKEIQILKELLKEKERKIAEEEVKEKQILKELLREKEKRKAEEEEERLLLQEILQEKEKKKAEDEDRDRQHLRDLIREKEKIVNEEKLKEKEKRKRERRAEKERKKTDEQKQRSVKKDYKDGKEAKSTKRIKKEGTRDTITKDGNNKEGDKEGNNKEGNVKQSNAKEGNIKEDNTKENNCKESNLRESNSKESNYKENNHKENNHKDNYYKESPCKISSTKGSNSKESCFKESNAKEAYFKDVNAQDINLKDVNIKESKHKELNVKEVNHKELNHKELNHKEVNHKEVNHKEVNNKEVNHKEVNHKELNHKEYNHKDVNHKDLMNSKSIIPKEINHKEVNPKEVNHKNVTSSKEVISKEIHHRDVNPKEVNHKALDHREITKDNYKNILKGVTSRDNYKDKDVSTDIYKDPLDEYYKDRSPLKDYQRDILRELQREKTKYNLKELIKENNKEIFKESHKELIKEYHKDKINIEERLNKRDDKRKDKPKKKHLKVDRGDNTCDGRVPSRINFHEKDSSHEKINLTKTVSDENANKRMRYASCLTEPPVCSSSRLFREQLESLEKIPEEETIKDSLDEGKKSKRRSLKVEQGVMAYRSMLGPANGKKERKRSLTELKEGGMIVESGTDTMEVEIGNRSKQNCFPTEQEDLFHLSKSQLFELDTKNIKQDPRFWCAKKKDHVELIEKGIQIPSSGEKTLLIDQSKTSISKCSLSYEKTSNDRFQIAQLYNKVMENTNDSTADVEVGTETEARSLPTTATCYSNHIVSIKDSLLHFDDGKLFGTASPKVSNEDLSKRELIDVRRPKPELVSVSTGIPIYKEGFEIARITNQTSSCFSTIRRYARASVNKSTQMFEHVTSNDLYTLKWIHDNLFEIDINPHTLIVDEKIKELSEMSGVS